MPSNPEQLLISSVLRNRTTGYTEAITCGVKPEMFKGYAEEWKWITSYVNRHLSAPTKGAFLNQFPDFRVKLVDDVAHFCDLVRTAHARAELTASIKEMGALLAADEISEACTLIQDAAIKIGAQMGGLHDSNFAEDWEDIYKDVAKRKERFDLYGMAGVPTGFVTFDERTGGLGAGQLTVVGSRMGQGKSWTLMRMASAALMDGYNAHYSSLEMSKTEVGVRMHNMLSGRIGKTVFRAIDLTQGRDFDLDAYKAFLRTLRTVVKGSLTVSDTRDIGLPEIAAQIERYHPDVYFLDYMTLARVGGDGGWKAIGDFTKGLKDLAGKTQCSIVAAAQLNRSAASTQPSRPGPETLGQSDQIGQDADTLIFGQKLSQTIIKYHVPKLRHGADNFGWHALLDTDRGKFEEVTYDEAKRQIELDKDRRDLERSNPLPQPRRLRAALSAG